MTAVSIPHNLREGEVELSSVIKKIPFLAANTHTETIKTVKEEATPMPYEEMDEHSTASRRTEFSPYGGATNEKIVEHLSVPEDVWERIDLGLAAERIVIGSDGQPYRQAIPGVMPMMNLSGRSAYRAMWNAIVANFISPWSAYTERDVNEGSFELKVDIYADLWLNATVYGIHVNDYIRLCDILGEAFWQLYRSAQSGGLRDLTLGKTTISEINNPNQIAQRPSLLGRIAGILRR